MTSPLAIEDRITEDSSLAEPVWRHTDLREVARLVCEVTGEDPLVDLWETFGDPAEPDEVIREGSGTT